jgi:hypothetical protein
VLASGESADARAIAGDMHRLAEVAGQALRDLLAELPAEDRMLLRLRFGSEMSIADVSRMMRLPQRPLYRRLDWLLARLRNALAGAGIDQKTAAEMVGSDAANLNFGLANGKSALAGQSIADVVQNAREET